MCIGNLEKLDCAIQASVHHTFRHNLNRINLKFKRMCSDLDKTQITRDWLDKYRKIISSDSLVSIFEIGRFGTVGGCVYSGVVSY